MENNKSFKISTGSFDLNKWLYGGYEKGVITMLVGPPGSGKTNLALLAACSQAKKSNKVIFIDTEGGFSIDRVKQITGDSYEEILKNIFILELTNFEEQEKCFEKLLSQIKKEQVKLIVMDGMAMLYRLELGDAIQSKEDDRIRKINRAVARQMRILAEISRKQQIPIIITNQVYGGFLSEEEWKQGVQKQVKIVGGDLFQYWSKCIIELKHDDGKRKAILLKHRSLGEKELSFEIKDKGIFKKGWI
ncbi:MAG: DNA repair and recombination protein RadB [Nanoarchaeota archaeon]|nr:DNA repair and recombination protein RadB [Nanoarchaeota archaeon]MBU4116254.1 DNA repair and recombination protein RadB [Nanoarchaeota archaeon]